MASIEELKLDVEELELLLSQSTRLRPQELLKSEIKRINNVISKTVEDAASKEVKVKTTNVYTKELNTYAWDQSDKFMKIYLTLKDVQTTSAENVTCDFKDSSFHLKVNNFGNINYSLHVADLSEDIVPSDSYYKLKKDTVLIMLKKSNTGKTWANVTKKDKEKKDKKVPKMDEKSDPQEGLMDMLKQMYTDGDDEMKKTIAKAWTESRDKNPGAGMGMPGMP